MRQNDIEEALGDASFMAFSSSERLDELVHRYAEFEAEIATGRRAGGHQPAARQGAHDRS